MKKLIIISNDKINFTEKGVSSNSNDTINIIESLSKKNYLFFLSRSIKNPQIHKLKLKKKILLKVSNIKSLNLNKDKIFMISITPYNFLIFIIINFFFKQVKGYVILRSDGFKEYYLKYGLIGKKIYNFFFKIILKKLKPIVVSKKLSNISTFKPIEIYPSEIIDTWKKNLKNPNISKAKLLYLGRIKKEKGIFSLLGLVKNLSIDYNLNIVGDGDKISTADKRIRIFKQISNLDRIINFYDKNNIFILPSYTEGSPKVILESLSRLRPVIVFNEILHVKKKMKGIFVINRNIKDLQKMIIYILDNYKLIQSEMKKNIIPTKKKFQTDLVNIVR